MLKGFEMELLKKFSDEYKRASKKRKGEILSQYCKLTGCKRKTAIKRFLRYFVNPSKKREKSVFKNKRGHKEKYGILEKRLIKQIWEFVGQICAEKIHPQINVYINQMEFNNKITFYPSTVVERVRNISLGTLKKIMLSFGTRKKNKHKGNADIYRQVPIIANFGKHARYSPGYVEVDYVEHNGGNSSGTYAITGCYVDIFSQWVARAAGLGKNLSSIESIDKKVHQKIFHPILHYHPDSEKSILKLLFERMKKGKPAANYSLSRSRPYKKNDNAHVEQKNGDKVRKLVGYFRYDTEKEIQLLNQLYDKADLFDYFFIACAKLKRKILNSKGKVIKRIYDTPQTPYQRLIKSKHIPKKIKTKLKFVYQSLNMVKLKEEMDEISRRLFEIMCGESKKNFRRQKLVSNNYAFRRHLINI